MPSYRVALCPCQDLTLKTQLEAVNRKKMPALEVFAHALRFFKEHALQELSEQCPSLLEKDTVRWVLTVPAIWKQPAKQFMREAAYLVRTRRQSCGCCSEGPRAWLHTLIHTPPLGPQSHRVKTASPTLLGILEGCYHQERGWACRNRELRDQGQPRPA